MKFLGDIGINVGLLAAQLINFGLLLWLLSKLVYKPVIRRIEKDEAELRAAEAQKQKIEQDRLDLVQQSQTMKQETGKHVEEMIQEAKIIATTLKNQTHDKAEKEMSAMIEQTKITLESQKSMMREEIIKEFREEIGGYFKTVFNEYISIERRREMQNALFENLIDRINAAPVPKIKDSNFIEALEEIKILGKEETRGKFRELLNQKIGPVILEYVFAPSKKQKDSLEKIISNKFGLDVVINWKEQLNLLDGFRLEIAGMVIESNFMDIVKNAANYKK